MTVEQYWMGKDLNLDALWRDFDNGAGYIQKIAASRLHILRLTVRSRTIPCACRPLTSRLCSKRSKAPFHDVKAECLPPAAYDRAAPIFLYRVDRGSGIF